MGLLTRMVVGIGMAAAAVAGGAAFAPEWADPLFARIAGADADPSELRPAGALDGPLAVSRVVDGDTVVLTRAGKKIKVRLIGINTPETVAPGRPVECFGREASAFAKKTLKGRKVWLEYDPVAGRTDRYGRTLAYLWLDRTHSFHRGARRRLRPPVHLPRAALPPPRGLPRRRGRRQAARRRPVGGLPVAPPQTALSGTTDHPSLPLSALTPS